MRPPTVYDAHQPGIVTPQPRHALLTAYDCDNPRALLREWTAAAERFMRAGHGTITLGLGAPALPPFEGDALDPDRCGGDLVVLIQSDAPPKRLDGPAPRWERRGTRHAKGALGFAEGTSNLRRPLDFDRHVWVSRNDRTEMIGGTYLVVRDILVNPTWHELDADEQERIIGRDKTRGAPLTGRRLYDKPDLEALPAHAHIRVASPRTTRISILRRGYDTAEGLLFLAFMADPRLQFTPLMRRLAQHDALHPHTRHVGSAVFAIPPGASRH